MNELDFSSAGSKVLRNSFLTLFEAIRGRSKGVIIASSQRCGTHLIGAYLKATNIGTPGEHFLAYLNGRATGTANFDQLASAVDEVIATGSGGRPDAFSLVMMRYSEKLESDLEAVGLSSSLLSRSMKHLTWVWLRRDWIDVAVSHYFAERTGVWESNAGDHSPPPFDAKEIYRWWRHIQVTDAYWERYFKIHSVQPLEFSYEQVVRDPALLSSIATRAGGDSARLSSAAPPRRMPHAQCKQLYAARFRDYLAEQRSTELYRKTAGL